MHTLITRNNSIDKMICLSDRVFGRMTKVVGLHVCMSTII